MKKALVLSALLLFTCFLFTCCAIENPKSITLELEEQAYSLLYALSEGMIRYDFDDFSDIMPDSLQGYLNQRFSAFFSLDEAHVDSKDGQGWLTTEQVLEILKNDFGVDTVPFYSENSNTKFVIQAGVQTRGMDNCLFSKQGSKLFADVTYSFFPHPVIPEEAEPFAIDYYVRYTFEIQNNGMLIIKSGKRN